MNRPPGLDPALEHSLSHSLARWFGLDLARLGSWQRLLLALALLLFLGAAAFSCRDVLQYIGVDFRSRVVASRALLAGLDPYTFQWQQDMSERLLDPFISHDRTPRVTVPPTVLCLYAPLAGLSYPTQRLLSFALEWLALALSLALLCRVVPGQPARVLFLLAAVFFFAFSDFWRLHVERGQVYVFHLLPLSAGVYWCLRGGFDSWTAGAAFGLAAALRPNLLVLAPAFLVLGKYRSGLGTLLTCAVAVAATLPLSGVCTWQSYLQMGQAHYRSLWDPDSLPKRPVPPQPAELEGYSTGPVPALPELYSTSFPAYYEAWRGGLGLPVVDLGRLCGLLMVGLSAALLGLLWLGRRRPPARFTLLLIVVAALDLEFFLPQRWAYADIVYLLPLALAFGFLRRLGRPGILAAALLALAGLATGQALFFRHNLALATLARSALFMGTLSVLSISLWVGRRRFGLRRPAVETGAS
jgi:hypothetical protein